MAHPKPAVSSGVDIPDLIEVICGYRKELFPFEKYVALMAFSTWLRAPVLHEIVLQSKIVAAALMMLSINNGQVPVSAAKRKPTTDAISTKAFRPLDAADALVNRVLTGTFREMFDARRELFDAGAVAAFIIRCPLELKPSINKALFFIDEGGFIGEIHSYETGDNVNYAASYATVKKSWGLCAIASPFWLAAEFFSLWSIAELAPDDRASILKARNLLDDTQRIGQYFARARFIQDLCKRLDKSIRNKIAFVQFPKSVAICEDIPDSFNADQLELIKRYRAPKFI